MPVCPLGLTPRAIPLALCSQDCPSEAIQGALGLDPAPHQEETSLVSSFSAHFTHHLVSRRHLSAQALENAAHGRPATLLLLFLLSLVRQGSIKRVFALPKPRITPHLLKVFSAGLRLSSPPPTPGAASKRAGACSAGPCRVSRTDQPLFCSAGCVPGWLQPLQCPHILTQFLVQADKQPVKKGSVCSESPC